MEQTNRILAEVALRLYETQDQTAAANPVSPELRDAQSFPVQLLLLVLEQIHEELRGLGVPDQPEIMAPWVKESGTLEVVVPEKIYRFVHHTYQEYLAAMGLAKRLVRAREPLAGKARHIMDRQRFAPHWAEPMRMLAGALVAEGDELRLPAGREFAKAWLANLLRQARDPQSLDRDAALALAVASLREIPNIESFGPQVDAAGMLDAWVEALLRTAAAGPAQTLGDLQRLAPDVAMLPSSLVRPPLDRLRSALEENGHPAPQIAAAQALAGMGDLADTEALERLLLAEDASQVARLEAARALCRVETRDLEHPGQAALERVLVSSNRDLARIVARALVEMGDVGYPLMLLATEDSRDAEVRQLGVLALGGVGPSARNTLQVLASDRDPEVAARAVEMLSRLGEDFETLLPVLTHMAEQGAKAATVASVLASLLPYTLRDLDFQGEVSEGVAAILPPLCLVPEGDFLMGSDRQKDRLAEDDELRQHTVTLGSYQIGAYPVTVAEYACFVRTGYKEPVDWQAQLERLDHPVVNVMWHDAMSYAVWLGRLTGQPWRLPTEAEWEKAARGSDGWIYPWGDAFDNARCNTIESSANGTTPVGSYRERGDSSPYNVHDMAGNVWEWTISLFRPYPYSQSDGSDISQDRGNRVLRGGSWSDQPGHARAAYRANFAPVSFNRSYGFRLVLPTAAGA
jgi:formylglycine-generating enzyme required for sulfatase activity